ncbi:sorting nexin mvp1 like protein [Tanacetum coccineum]
MESSSNKYQLRSISLPSRLIPTSSRIEINLNKLRMLVPFYTSTSIDSGLVCLYELYLSVDELIASSQLQKVNLLQYGNKNLVEDALVGSIGLLDSYNHLIELLVKMKDDARILQFALRRRKGVGMDANSETHIRDYALSRKIANKNIVVCLKSLQQIETEVELCLAVGEDQHLSIVIGFLREIVIATISMFRAILICLSGKTKPDNGFSLIQKLLPVGRPSCEKGQEIIKEADIIDGMLRSLLKNVKKNEGKTVDLRMVIERLQYLDCHIQGYEVGLDSLFRKMIHTRVSLLNILAN